MTDIEMADMCSQLRKKLTDENGDYHDIWMAIQKEPDLTAAVRSRQLHIYRGGKKILVLAGKSNPKTLRDDVLCGLLR